MQIATTIFDDATKAKAGRIPLPPPARRGAGIRRRLAGFAADEAAGDASATAFKATVAPFFKTYCVKCHGPDKSKGEITVHSLDGDLSMGQELEKWESILEMLEFGEMPPIDEPQPTKPEEVEAVKHWIESGMRDYVEKASQETPEPKTRRLTNVEYENTLSESAGFRV